MAPFFLCSALTIFGVFCLLLLATEEGVAEAASSSPSSSAKISASEGILTISADEIRLLFASNGTTFVESLYSLLRSLDGQCCSKANEAVEELRREFNGKIDQLNLQVTQLQAQLNRSLSVDGLEAQVVEIVNDLVPSNGPGTLTQQLNRINDELGFTAQLLEDSLSCQDQGLVIKRTDDYNGCQNAIPGPQCSDAPDLSSVEGANLTACSGHRFYDSCSVTCKAGYDPSTTLYRCINGTWMGYLSCRPSSCNGSLPGINQVSNHFAVGTCNKALISSGSACTMGCATGYEPTLGANMVVLCSLGSYVPMGIPQCAPSLCKTNLTAPSNGLVSSRTGKTGDNVTYGCNVGYELQGTATTQCLPDGTWSNTAPTCQDINECGAINGGCQQICSNVEGSFACSCNSGYRLNADKRNCSDIDECAEKSSDCAQNCQNAAGSFTCSCNTGYSLNVNHSCTALACPDLVLTTGLSLSPNNIHGVTGDVRTFSCASGSVLTGVTSISCTAPNWSNNVPTCVSLGLTSASAAANCLAILNAGTSTGSGNYWLNPSSPFQAYCDMATNGGGWTLLTDSVANTITAGNKQYMLLYGSNYYLTPVSSLNWKWASGQQLTGTYSYLKNGATGTFGCGGSGEVPQYGIGCSNGGGGTCKMLGAYNSNPSAGTITICQDCPAAFPSVCQTNVLAFYRPA